MRSTRLISAYQRTHMKLKKVSKSLYDKQYYENDIKTTVSRAMPDANSIADLILNIHPVHHNDYVIDFGCGSGSLAFQLHQHFKCRVLGIDYSQDAIDFCNKLDPNNSQLKFLCSDVEDLPIYEDITHVYMADVVEHLYDNELMELFSRIAKWNTKANLPTLIIHTDNNLFIKYIRPFVDLILLIINKTSITEIRKRNAFERPRHVNLMTPGQLDKKLRNSGFVRVKINYPEITRERLASQIPQIGGNLVLSKFLIGIYPLIKFVAPSFYTVYVKSDVHI